MYDRWLNEPCPGCGTGWLEQHSETMTITDRHSGERFHIDGILFAVCTHCCNDFVTPDQAKYNDSLIEQAKDSPF